MTSVLSAVEPPPDFALETRGELSDLASKRARHQAALVTLGRRNLASLERSDLEREVLSLVSETLDACLCALVDVLPDSSPPTVDRVQCIPEDAHPAGELEPQAKPDALLTAVLEKSARLVVADVQTDGRFRASWFYRQGVRSALALPLSLNQQSLGALLVGHAEAGRFDEDDLLFLELVGSLFAAHAARAQAEEAVRQEREYIAALLDHSPALSVTLDAAGNVTRTNRACLTLAGLRHEQIVGQPFWLSLCVPTEAKLAEASFAQLSGDVSAVEFESTLFTSDGERRFVNWRLCYFHDQRNGTPTIVATGIDITDQRKAEQEARQAIVAAQAARRLVDELRSFQPGGANNFEPVAARRVPNRDASQSTAAKRGSERRTSQRTLFPYQQQIAPYENGVVPPRESFVSVRFWDISAGGVSFLLDYPPRFKSLVVQLGGGSVESLVTAEVVRVTELNEDGTKGFLVGCRFTGKI